MIKFQLFFLYLFIILWRFTLTQQNLSNFFHKTRVLASFCFVFVLASFTKVLEILLTRSYLFFLDPSFIQNNKINQRSLIGMLQNGQTHLKNLAAFVARSLKCVGPFWDIMHQRVKAVIK